MTLEIVPAPTVRPIRCADCKLYYSERNKCGHDQSVTYTPTGFVEWKSADWMRTEGPCGAKAVLFEEKQMPIGCWIVLVAVALSVAIVYGPPLFR